MLYNKHSEFTHFSFESVKNETGTKHEKGEYNKRKRTELSEKNGITDLSSSSSSCVFATENLKMNSFGSQRPTHRKKAKDKLLSCVLSRMALNIMAFECEKRGMMLYAAS